MENKDSVADKLLRAVEEFHTYITNNQAFITNYGERYRQGDRISSSFVESAVNYVVVQSGNKCNGVLKGRIYSYRCEHGYSTVNWNKYFEIGILAFGRRMMKNSKILLNLPPPVLHALLSLTPFMPKM